MGTKDLLAVSEVGDLFSVDETLKMERAILVILDWDLNRSTPLKFLEIIHTLMTYAGSCEPYGSPNATALHLHGMHVSMTGLGDAVMRTAAVGEKLIFDLEIDEDHPTGTFWYHPH